MRCPVCNNEETKVIETRENEEGTTRRRRECIACTTRFTTHEHIQKLMIGVVKRNHSIEMYDRDKLVKGILHACHKRPVTMQEVNRIIDEIEQEIRHKRVQEIPSEFIGKRIMEQLKILDEVAYIRFASVYLKFSKANEFRETITELKEVKE